MSVLSKVLNGAGSPTQPTGLFVAAGLFVGTLGQVTAWLGMRSLGTPALTLVVEVLALGVLAVVLVDWTNGHMSYQFDSLILVPEGSTRKW